MKILVGDKGNVDFDSAIPLTESQQDQFIKFMKTIFNPVKKLDVNNFRTERLGDKIFMRKWDDSEEIAMLLDVNIPLDKVCENLGRTWMSVTIKRGEIIPDLMRWADMKGYNLIQGDTKEIIEKYFDEMKEIAKQKRTKESQLKKEIYKINDKIDKLDQRINTTKLGISVGLLSSESEKKIKITEKEIEKLVLERSEKFDELFEDAEIIEDDGEIEIID